MGNIVVELAVAGVMVGTLYGLVAVTLTLMLRSSGILSFAHAGFALISAYLYAGMECKKATGAYQQCAPTPWLPPYAAAVVAVAASIVVALLVERLVARPLERASAASKVIATAAVLGLISGVLLQTFGPQPRYTPPQNQILPKGSFTAGGIVISWQRFSIFLVSIVVIALVGLLLRKSWFGLGVRAAGQLPDVARLMGVSPVAVSRFNWGLGGGLAGLAGVLIGPVTVVNIGTFSFLLVKAVGATLIGGLVSLPLTFVGGIGIGVAEAVVPHYWKTPGTASVATAVIVLGMLYVYGKRFAVLGYAGPTHDTAASGPVAVAVARVLCGVRDLTRLVPKPVWLVAGASALVVPFKSAYYASVGVSSLYFCLIALSILVFTGTTGSLTFMQAGFAAIGAFGLATALHHGWSFLPALGLTVAACAVTGAVIGRLSLRFRGLEFAIASVAVGAVLSEFLVTRPGIQSSVPNPVVLGRSLLDARNLYGLALVLTAIALLIVFNIRRSYWGRSLTAMQELHTRVAHFGIAPVRSEVALLALSAALAGLSGAFLGLTVISLDPFLFVPILSVTMVLAGVVGGLTTLWGPVVAGLVFGVGQEVVGRVFSGEAANAFPQIASAGLALILVVKMPGGLAAMFGWAEDVMADAPDPKPRAATVFRGLPMAPAPPVEGPLGRGGGRLARPRRLGMPRPAAARFRATSATNGARDGGSEPALAGNGRRTLGR
ncbi:MAG TPA: ABC transporter permease [Acidimicrobiia bacterium]|nr:ABC transporter permease [Acidimicrobiia bacterium]